MHRPATHRRSATPLATPRATPRAPARGVALIVGLVLLVLLALIGTTAYSVATQEERMAGNARDHARAFQAAEAALRECERIAAGGPQFDPNGAVVPGMYRAVNAPVTIGGRSLLWRGDADAKDFLALTSPGICVPMSSSPACTASMWSRAPQCIAEAFDPHLPGGGGKVKGTTMNVARVTALGFGLNTGTSVRLVSYVSFYQ
jgi:Tfp pilus assembly protein PilX